MKTQNIETIKAKEFLTVRDVSILLNCSIRTAYYLIANGTIKSVNISQRKTLIKRTEIDKLFISPQAIEVQSESVQYEISDCYTLTEIQTKFRISNGALYNLIKRNNLPKIKKWKFTYVPKHLIDKLLS